MYQAHFRTSLYSIVSRQFFVDQLTGLFACKRLKMKDECWSISWMLARQTQAASLSQVCWTVQYQ